MTPDETTEGLGLPEDVPETELYRDAETDTGTDTGGAWSPPPGFWFLVVSTLASVALVVSYILAGGLDFKPDPAPDPCEPRQWKQTETIEGLAEQFALSALNGAACDLGVSRGELTRALATPESLDRFTRDNGLSDTEVEEAIRAGAGRAIDDAEGAGAIDPLVALGLRVAIRSLPLADLIDLIQGGGAVLGESGDVQGLLEDVLRGVEQGQTPDGGFDLGQALEGFFGGSGGQGKSNPADGFEGLLPEDADDIQQGLQQLFGPS
ncbi:MAG: hypothetical protein ACKOB2_01360 [Solirubrobacterales bacterium]